MYLIILTLSLNFGMAGMGGVEAHEFNTMKDCQKVGKTWLASVEELRTVQNSNTSASFVCIRIEDKVAVG
jgi:hypothetical protein